MSNQKTQVVTYSRVTAKEQTKGYSLEFQREQLKKYAEKNNLEIVRKFSDIGSSVRGKRQGLNEMLKFLENSEDCKTILVTKPDRLCRDIKTFSELQDNYSIISICNGANNLVNQLQIMLAQQYSENLSKSIKAGLQKRKVEEIKNEEVNMEEHSKNKTSQ